MKKLSSSNLTKFHPAQMPRAGLYCCMSLPGGDSEGIFLKILRSLTVTLRVTLDVLMNCFIRCSPVRNLVLSLMEFSEIYVHSAKVLNVF